MTFNSKSVTLNKGVNLRLNVQCPNSLRGRSFPSELWLSAIKEFNVEMDKRHQVKEIIAGIEIDVLRLGITADNFFIWAFAGENDVATFKEKLMFTLRGKLIYENENRSKIERILIEDLLYKTLESEVWNSIFKKRLTS